MNCAWSKWSEILSNPEGYPGECVAKYRDLGASTDLPQGFHRVTTIAEFHAHVDTTRAALAAYQQLQEWKTIIAPLKIKAEAQRRIFALTQYNAEDPIPGIIRQLNMTTNAVRILARKVFDNIEPTVGEAAQVSGGVTLVDKVNAVRAYSNTLEARAAGGEVFDISAQPWPY